MRVLQLHARYREAGGEDRVVAAEAQLLRSAGHEVEQLLAENPTSPLRRPPPGRVPAQPGMGARCRGGPLRGFRPDVAHVHNTWYSMSPSVMERFDSAVVPTVMTVHNYRLMCLNGMFLRDGRPCEDCLGRSPGPGVQHRCYHDSTLASGCGSGDV